MCAKVDEVVTSIDAMWRRSATPAGAVRTPHTTRIEEDHIMKKQAFAAIFAVAALTLGAAACGDDDDAPADDDTEEVTDATDA